MKRLLLMVACTTCVFADESIERQRCIQNNGIIESMPATYADLESGFAFFRPDLPVCKIGNRIVGLETLSDKPTIAATYILKLNQSALETMMESIIKLPNYRPGANQSSYVCNILKGQENPFKDKDGETNVCLFSDFSAIDSWALVYIANDNDLQVKQMIKSKPLTKALPYLK